MPVLHNRLESQPLRVPKLSLLSGFTNYQNPKQCGLMFPEEISRAKCPELLRTYPLPVPFLFLLPVGWDGEMDVS